MLRATRITRPNISQLQLCAGMSGSTLFRDYFDTRGQWYMALDISGVMWYLHVMAKRLPSNWRSRIELVYEEDKWAFGNVKGSNISFVLQFKKGHTPSGFRQNIGMLHVEKCGGKWWVEQSFLDDHFCRRGLGTMLYTAALSRYGSLTTTYHKASDDAQGLWKSLVRTHRHETDFWKGELTVFAS